MNVKRAGGFFSRDALLMLLVAWSVTSLARAAAPRDDLLRLVPHNIGFCLLIEDLRGHGDALARSPFIKQFQASALGNQVLESSEVQKLTELDRFLQQQIGVNAQQLRDEILGDELVLAYRPGPPGKPDQEQGLLLVRAHNPNLLAQLIDKVNQSQQKSGDLRELKEEVYQGHKYFRRTDERSVTFYYLRGPILVLAFQEPILREVIELEATDPAESPVAREFRQLGVEKPLVALWLNPRTFEAALVEKAAAAEGGEAVFMKSLLRYWKALDGIAFSLVLEKDIELKVALRARFKELPPAAQRFLSSVAKPSELWDRFPDKAIFILAGRVDFASLLEAAGDFVSDDARQALRAGVENTVGAILGKGVVQELLTAIGPDLGLCVVAPAGKDAGWIPQVLVALAVRAGEKSADLSLLGSLTSLATLVVYQQNGGRPGALTLKSKIVDSAEVKYLDNPEQFPVGFQPAFTLQHGFLLVGSSPAAIQRFQPAEVKSMSKRSNPETPLLRLSLKNLQTYLADKRSALVDFAAEKNHLSPDQAAQYLDKLQSTCRFFDWIELTQVSNQDRVIFTLRVRMDQPLK